jgi:hypothetical protein
MASIRSRRAGALAIVAGLAIATAAQVSTPRPGPPLYDGVVVTEPYLYVDPTGTEQGGAGPAATTQPVAAGVSPSVVLRTPETPPQAQLIAAAGQLVLPPGTTSIVASITPIATTVTPASGAVVGNAYRVTVANQAGAPVTGQAGAQVTLALRDPGSTGLARIDQLVNGAWVPLATVSASVTGTYETTGVTTFGDFALVGSTRAAGDDPRGQLITAGAILIAVLAVGVGWLRGRRPAPANRSKPKPGGRRPQRRR